MRQRYIILFLIAAGMIISVPQLVAQNNQLALVSRILQVVDTEPLIGQELTLSESITIFFDRPIDCATVPTAFSIVPQVAGDLSCDENAFTFIPTENYERANTYVVQLETTLLGADGAQLLDPFVLELDTIGFLAVSETFPVDDTQFVDLDTTLTVIFNRPVVPLVTSVDTDQLINPLRIIPEIDGQGAWLNSSIYQFEPDTGLAGGTTYSVQIAAGLTTPDGAVLPKDFMFNFTTVGPSITMMDPQRDAVLLDRMIQVRFNQPIDRDSAENNFFLNPEGSEAHVPGIFKWNEADTGFSYTPDENLQIDTTYLAGFNAGVVSATGGASLEGTTSWTFTTVPLPAVLSTFPSDGMEDVEPYRGFEIHFASPMNEETIADKITIEPKPAVDPDLFYREYSETYTVSFIPYPATEYTVTLAPGAEDIYGNRIEQPLTFSYTTGSFEAEVRLQTPGDLGFYNAQRDPTQVFLSYRNVDTIQLSLYAVPVQRFIQTLVDGSYYSLVDRYQPKVNELVRDWKVVSPAPPDAMRFDLLEFDQEFASGVACNTTLPSRLQVGDSAIVVTEPEPVRARAAAPDGEIIELLFRDYNVPVIGGPLCSDQILWWEVQLRDGTAAWVAESVEDEYLLDLNVPGSGVEVEVEAAEGEGGLAPGIYYLRAEAEETTYRDPRHMMIVANANLVVKNSQNRIMVWATDVDTGQVLAGVPIQIYSSDFVEVGSGVTDESGLLMLDVSEIPDLFTRRIVVLNDGRYFGMGLSEWTDGIELYQFGQSYNFYPDDGRSYLYTDRPIYRPGQPVHFRGIVREKEDVRYFVPQFDTVLVTANNDRGETIYEEELPLSPFGSFTGQLELDPDASLGRYSIAVEVPPGAPDVGGGRISFSVAEFRLPEFQVEVTPTEPEVVQGDMVEVVVDSTFFFGGPVSNAIVNYNVLSEDFFFNFEGEGRYDFVDYDYDSGPRRSLEGRLGGVIADGEAETNEAGQFTISIPADLADATQSQSLNIEATVRDESGQVVAGRSSVVVHFGEVYVGVRPASYVGRTGTENNLEIITVDWNSNPVPNQEVNVEVVERRWSSFQERDASGRTVWRWEVEEIPVDASTVRTDADGLAVFPFEPPNGGVFKARVRTRDDNGNEILASTTTWVSSRSYVPWRQQNSNRIDLVADQENYSVGDTASILITSPFQGSAEALITIERGDVLFTEQITMDSNSFLYDLPITGDYAPNIYVSVFVVKGVDETHPVAGFRMGYIEFGVETDRKVLDIDIRSNVDQAGPRETVTYTVTTRDFAGNPVPAEVGVGVTDLAALSIVDSNSRPILSHFYSDQSLSVRTSTALTINADQLTQEIIDTVKGGGGGLGLDGLIEIRDNFIDTPFWDGSIVTDESGTATFEVVLPDNLTTWRLDARAVTLAPDGNMLVGQEIFDLISTKPLLIRPVTPRFFVVDDEVTLAAVVNNNTDEDQEVVVSIDATGVTLKTERAQTVTVPARGRTRVEWPVSVDHAEQAQMTFTADSGQYNDGSISPVSLDSEGTLPIYRYEVPETVGTAGTLATVDTQVETIMLPRRFDVSRGELIVQVDQSLAASTIDGLDYLKSSSLRSVEHTVSRFLPNILITRALSELNVDHADLQDGLDLLVNLAIQKLVAEQKPDGGWGWYTGDHSNEYTTAYALIALHEAREQGFAVPPNMIVDAQQFLRSGFISINRSESFWRLNRQTFMLYALARSGAPDVARTATMFEVRDRLSLYAQAHLAETLRIIDPTDTRRLDELVNTLVNEAAVSAAGAHWDEVQPDYWNWNTGTRTSAIVLRTLILLRPNSDLLPDAVRYLMVQREADHWETTQETAWSVMALADWMLASGELEPEYSYDISLNTETLASGTATRDTVREWQELRVPVSELLQEQANELIVTRTGTDKGVLYYTAYLEAFLPVPEVEAQDNGIVVQRRYALLEDPDNKSISKGHVGDVVEVRLTIVAPNSLHYVVIDDPIPAGAEAIDTRLNTAQQVGTRPGLDNSNPLRYGWGWWWFSNIEFHDEKVRLSSSFLPAGTYEYVYTMRLGVPGTYNVIPTTAQETYFPDVSGRSEGLSFTILPDNE